MVDLARDKQSNVAKGLNTRRSFPEKKQLDVPSFATRHQGGYRS